MGRHSQQSGRPIGFSKTQLGYERVHRLFIVCHARVRVGIIVSRLDGRETGTDYDTGFRDFDFQFRPCELNLLQRSLELASEFTHRIPVILELHQQGFPCHARLMAHGMGTEREPLVYVQREGIVAKLANDGWVERNAVLRQQCPYLGGELYMNYREA